MAVGRLARVVFDAGDADAVIAFYASLTGWPRVDPFSVQTPTGPLLAIQPVPEHVPPRWPGQELPAQVHLDFDVAELAPAVERAVQLGAVRLGGGEYWVTLADPAGHPFDLCRTRAVTSMSRLWVHLDTSDPSAAARFYGELLGMPIVHDDEVGAALGARPTEVGTTLFFCPVEQHTRPRWPDPAFPQQAHLDIAVADIDSARATAVRLGAVPLTETVLADPDGHPFCLVD
ncbi:VOC family protein [Cryptosporangium phraense]|uniref:VOC family protein n=1 Tax=Cryptosporangium phraense TaxID=2593070 RepID=A0A545AFR4_9ACTN|nr:VOC family protein [Cryptosporangium phraense]TQS40100.1 VOC family protein [Cryptosporangium phraense]